MKNLSGMDYEYVYLNYVNDNDSNDNDDGTDNSKTVNSLSPSLSPSDNSVEGNHHVDGEMDDDVEDSGSEQELTNLGWLTDLKKLASWPDIVAGGTVDDDEIIEPISDKSLSEERFKKFMIQVKQSQQIYLDREDLYRNNEHEKPPFNYAQIIAMAMMDCGKMTLKDICKWIQDRFAYFRCNDNWNNSIRHNLSLHFCFTKIARGKNEKGKGGYWELSMNTTKSERKRIRNRRKRFLNDNNSKATPTAAKYHPRKIKKPSKANIAVTEIVANEIDNNVISSEELPGENVNSCVELDVQELISDGEIIVRTEPIQFVLDPNDIQFNATIVASNELQEFEERSVINDGSNEIFLGCDIPLSGDCVIIPYNCQANGNQTTDDDILASNIHSAYLTPTGTQQNGPNVIVEPMPYTLSEMDTVLDIERELSNFVDIPDPAELVENGYFDYTNW
ncbi:Forkhead box protein J1 [Pseudolycoriella hygida]|uniref:Forkhead box protein J1 n=1 Tax=Pseudolycoriella hygida TaxID=35572 RepID=A0A9Q0N057_9DIPT|nr:Forkhead box protein J1 [Pseudolycoriella hygida]